MTNPEKNILITDASHPVGRECMLLLAKSGYCVWAGAKDPARLAKTIRPDRNNIRLLKMDTARPGTLDRALDEVISRTDSLIHAVINTSDLMLSAPVEEMPAAALRALYEANYFGFLQVLKKILPAMRKMQEGKIINVSPLTRDYCIPYFSQYFSAKAGMEQLIAGLRTELLPFRIQASSLLYTWTKDGRPAAAARDNDPRSVYSRYMYHTNAEVTRAMRKGVSPEKIARRVRRLLLCRRMKPKYYTTSFPQSLLFYFTRFLPKAMEEEMMLAYIRFRDKRRYPRTGIHRDILLSTGEGPGLKVKVLDISRRGIRFEYRAERVRIGKRLRIAGREFEVLLLSNDLDRRTARLMFRYAMNRNAYRDFVRDLRGQ